MVSFDEIREALVLALQCEEDNDFGSKVFSYLSALEVFSIRKNKQFLIPSRMKDQMMTKKNSKILPISL